MLRRSTVNCGVVLDRAGSVAVQVGFFSRTTIHSGVGQTKTGAMACSYCANICTKQIK